MKFEYHFEPETGWMNDPNGLCFFGGQYHAFFQYNPHAPVWGTMHWGHAVSDDLISWKQVQTALCPDQEYENAGGCYSGSAIENGGKLHLFYTAVSERYGQAQATAVSVDGLDFQKSAENPVIPHSLYCDAKRRNKDFRDPKVFEAFGKYCMVVGTCHDGEGQVLLYTSRDLKTWTFENILYATREFGGTLECPDLFELGGKWVLMFSAMKPTVASTVFVTGSFDGRNFMPEGVRYSEYGEDFYAPQTFAAPDGRRIMIGWFYHWGKSLPMGATTAGALSIPRELYLSGDRVYNRPVREAGHLLTPECEYVRWEGTVLSVFGFDGTQLYEKDFSGVNGIEKIEKTEILFDRKAVEIFINGGVASVSLWLT